MTLATPATAQVPSHLQKSVVPQMIVAVTVIGNNYSCLLITPRLVTQSPDFWVLNILT